MASSWLKPTLVIAGAHNLISVTVVGCALLAYEPLFTSIGYATLVVMGLMVGIAAPALWWIFFAWIASFFNRRTPATATFILGLLVCAFGCIMIVKSTTGRGIDGHGVDAWWPFLVFGISMFQCVALALPLGFVWSVVALDELERGS